MTRGERNNNPGNVDRTTDRWQGMCEDQSGDSRFVVFETPEFGIRALGKVLLSYQRKYKIRSVRGIINRWAPPTENNTESYIEAVSAKLGVDSREVINLEDPHILRDMVVAIIHHENGRCVYDDSVIDEGVTRALA